MYVCVYIYIDVYVCVYRERERERERERNSLVWSNPESIRGWRWMLLQSPDRDGCFFMERLPKP